VQVGGLIANVGQRMISGVAKLIINQALKKLVEELAQFTPSPPGRGQG
jgi:carbon monoxide dehydrogenase subunit G